MTKLQARKKPQPSRTGAFLIPLAPGQTIWYCCCCDTPTANSLLDISAVGKKPARRAEKVVARLCQNVKKAINPERVDHRPTPVCHDLHGLMAQCWERQVPALSMQGKWGTYA